MLVKHWMSRNAITIDTDATLEKAAALMKLHRIRMLPVLKNGFLEGIITDRDLKRASVPDEGDYDSKGAQAAIKIKAVMTKNPVCILFDRTIDETAQLLLDYKISGAPVVDGMDNFIGVITQTNVYKALISMTGGHKNNNNVQFGLVVNDTRNAIKEIDELLRSYGGRVISILTSDDNLPPGYRKVFFRMSDIDRPSIDAIAEDLQTKGDLIYIINHHDNVRMIYK